MRLNSALDENERLDNELVGQLVRQARVKSATTSPLKSRNTIEVREGFSNACLIYQLLSIYEKAERQTCGQKVKL